ncbi:hypothetical protein [Alloactinosynnema sp. L-07]|uniref:DUF397 domain-containing protein n=1 Tax=Alloactinosynnema sp. L-07 TaxID=1653480 RepID=UPI00065F00CB|nr:DUF397 domain-containing protein [Alloactinosynnema sp. L-07]CRK55670.1 hypothetical protein [Alloactinosynnema sp. L-07]
MHAQWRKSSFSSINEAECVEVAYQADVRVRDSKNPAGGDLTFGEAAWQRLVSESCSFVA